MDKQAIIKQVLIVSADFSKYDRPVLLVGSLENGKTNIINTFEHDKAIEVYKLLTENSIPGQAKGKLI